MTVERFQRAESAFLRALDAPEHAREDELRDACAGDADLEAEVRRLLRAHHGAGEFLAQPHAPEPDADAPRRFGPWTAERRLGAGGMGRVYLCRRDDDQFEKKVAVKEIHRWIDGDDILRRFEQERRVLAQLQHPNIAALYDAGVADDGRPWIAMEYVDGLPVDAWRRERRPSVEETLRLFLDVCAAVQAAHQALIVHLDIKPANILVDRDGRVKLVDFGVAQIMNRSADDAENAPAAFTPAYAAPEQIEGRPVSTAADVYALGAVLYRLLTDARPFSAASSTPERSIEQTILAGPPTPPSGAAIDPGDAMDERERARRRRRLRGDLDAIVLKAMARDPRDRYPSPAALADDLERHLDGRTVVAVPDSFAYRTSRFVRRNRIPVAAAALVALTLTAGVAGVAWQAAETASARDRAEERFNELRTFANSVLNDVDDRLIDVPGAIDARRALVETAGRYLDSLAADLDDDPDLMLEVASAYARLGVIRRNATTADLGETDAAIADHERARDLRLRVLELRPDDPDAVAGLAESGVFLGDMHRLTGDLDAAVASYRLSDQRYRRLHELRDDLDLAVLHNRAVLLTKLGIIHMQRGELDEAEAAYAESITLSQQVIDAAPDRLDTVRNRAVNLERLGEIRELRGDAQGAFDRLTQAHAVYVELAERAPGDATPLFTLAVSHSKLAEVLGHPAYSNLGDVKGALREMRAGERIVKRLVEADPDDARARAYDAFYARRLGAFLSLDGQYDEALAYQRRAHDAASAILDGAPDDPRALADLASAKTTLAATHAELEDHEQALRRCDEAIALLRRAAARTPDAIPPRHQLAAALHQSAASTDDGATPRLNEARDILSELNRIAPDNQAVARDLDAVRQDLDEIDGG